MRNYNAGIHKRRPTLIALTHLGLTKEEIAVALHCSKSTIMNDLRRIKRHDGAFVVPATNQHKRFSDVLHEYAELSGAIQPDQELLQILQDWPPIQALRTFLDGAVFHYFSLKKSGQTIPVGYKRLLKGVWHDPYLWDQGINSTEARDLAQSVFSLFLTEVAEADEMSFSPESARAHLLKILNTRTVRSDIVLHTDGQRLVAIVRDALTKIPANRAQALKMHFGIDGPPTLYKEIGQQFGGLTRARIGQYIKAGLANLQPFLPTQDVASCVWTFSSLFAEQRRLEEENQRMREENEKLRDQLRSVQQQAGSFSFSLESDPDVQRILDTPTAGLELSVRSMHCLEAANIQTVRELVQWKREELLKIKNLGRKSLNEILDVLAELHPRLYVGMHFSD